MNMSDPSAPETGIASSLDREFTVEEIAQIDALETIELDFPQEKLLEASETPATLPTLAEDNAASDLGEPSEASAAVLPKPVKLIPIIKHRVSGRYSNCPRPWKLELRVDVDGFRPMKKVSGDFYHLSGSTTSLFWLFYSLCP